MAIFSKTQFPKYQNPIRITRPYIQPNYLADTINSAIQGYGSIQNMNMQQQLFNAKLKAAADAKAKDDIDKAAYASMINAYQPGVPAGPATMNLQGGDPYGIAGIPAYSQGALNQTYQYDAPAVPSTSPMDSLKMAMQNNPNADPRQLVNMAAAIQGLNKTSTGGPSNWQLYREKTRQQENASKANTKLQTQRGTTVTTLLGDEFGDLLKGTKAEIAARFEPSTKPVYGERSWDRPETWGIGDRQIGTVTTGESGPLKLKAFVGRRVRDMAMWMLNNGYDEHEVRIQMARMREAGMASGKFDFVAAWGAVPSEIAKNIGPSGGQNQGGGTTSQRARGHNVRLPNS